MLSLAKEYNQSSDFFFMIATPPALLIQVGDGGR